MSRTSIWSALNSRMSAVQARDDRNLNDNIKKNNLACLCRNVCLHQHIIIAMDVYRKRLTVQFSSVQLLSRVRLFVTPWTAACQASLSIANSQSLLKLMSFESVMPSNDLILCRPLLLSPSIFPNIRVFSNESALCIMWPKYWFQLQHQSFQ